MNRANISYTRNHLSELLAKVKEGESVLIVDRQEPVARLEPVGGGCGAEWLVALVRRGVARAAHRRMDLKGLAAMPLPSAKGGGDILRALLADREEGR